MTDSGTSRGLSTHTFVGVPHKRVRRPAIANRVSRQPLIALQPLPLNHPSQSNLHLFSSTRSLQTEPLNSVHSDPVEPRCSNSIDGTKRRRITILRSIYDILSSESIKKR